MQRANSWTAILVLGVFTTTSSVGIFNAAARTATLSSLILFAFNGIFSPIISNLYGRGLSDALGRLYRNVSRWVFTGAFAVFLITVLLCKDILAIFGPEFVAGWTVLIILAGGELFNSAVGPTQRVLSMTRHQKVLMVATAGSAVMAVVACLALVPIYGALGAAAATAAATVLANVVTLLYVRRLLGVWPFGYEHAKPLLAGLLAAAAVYLGKLALPLSSAVLAAVIFTPVFLVMYVALLFAFGLGPSDRQLLAPFGAAIRRATRLHA